MPTSHIAEPPVLYLKTRPDQLYLMYDVMVIGGGPGGVTVGIFSKRRGLSALILDDPQSLSQAEEATIIDDWPGTLKITGMELVKNMRDHAKALGVDFRDEKALKITKSGDLFSIKTDKEEYTGKTVVFATGAKHRKVMVPGESEFAGKGVSYCASCDGPLYKGKKVFVIGGGDSAVTAAMMLKSIGADTTLVHRRDELRAVDALVKQVKKSGVKFFWNTILKEIKGDRFVKSAVLMDMKEKKEFEEKVDGIFIEIGTVPMAELAKECGVELDEAGFIKVDRNQNTNKKGVYAVGDCCNNLSKKITSAVGDGAVAADSIFSHLSE